MPFACIARQPNNPIMIMHGSKTRVRAMVDVAGMRDRSGAPILMAIEIPVERSRTLRIRPRASDFSMMLHLSVVDPC